ncbi:hypothetical protein KBD61_01990 [Patescibacteria group bacterium]|nr:hypothetical protein [Patescibacteria group bacterium]MBP9709781.1 hypothetical protein [Patescibacteria group bacterium]
MNLSLVMIHPALDRLTPRQKRLVALRVINPLASNSSLIRAAGYSPASVTGGGGKVIKSDKVKRALREIVNEMIIMGS